MSNFKELGKGALHVGLQTVGIEALIANYKNSKGDAWSTEDDVVLGGLFFSTWQLLAPLSLQALRTGFEADTDNMGEFAEKIFVIASITNFAASLALDGVIAIAEVALAKGNVQDLLVMRMGSNAAVSAIGDKSRRFIQKRQDPNQND